jgi:hypothetical protein
MLGLADEAWLRTVLQGAGFCALQVHRMPLMRRYRDLDEHWSAEVDEGGKRGAQLRALSTADAKASGVISSTACSDYVGDSGYEIPGLASRWLQ